MPCSDPQAYAEALMKIFHMPESQRREMGERGKKMIREKYNYALLAGKYMQILTDCAEGTLLNKERP